MSETCVEQVQESSLSSQQLAHLHYRLFPRLRELQRLARQRLSAQGVERG